MSLYLLISAYNHPAGVLFLAETSCLSANKPGTMRIGDLNFRRVWGWPGE